MTDKPTETRNESGSATRSSVRKLHPEFFWLIAIFLLALALRTVAVLMRDMITLDETSFARMTQNLLVGKAPFDITGTTTTEFSILYPMVTAAFAVFTRNVVAAGYAVSVLFGSLIILPVYLFGKVMWNVRVGRAAAALVAVLPMFVKMGSLVDGQSIFAFWLLCALFFGYRMQFTKRCMCGMLSGTCLGIAYLADPSALYYLVTLFTLLVIVGLRQELSNYANKAAVHFLLLFFLFAIPNIAYMTWQSGELTLSPRATDEIHAAINGFDDASPGREMEMYGLTPEGEVRLDELREGPGIFVSLVQEPAGFASAVAHRDYDLYMRNINGLIPVWLLPLIGLGLFKFAWTRREATKYGFFALALIPAVVLPLAWTDSRFVLPYIGILMLAIARGWIYLEEWTHQTLDDVAGWKNSDTDRKQLVHNLVTAVILVPLAVAALWSVGRTDEPLEFRNAGQSLKEQGAENGKIMSRESSTAWYAGAEQVALPYASIEATLDYGNRHGAQYLVVSRSLTDELRPELAPLMNTQNAYREELEPVYHSSEGTAQEIIVYRLK